MMKAEPGHVVEIRCTTMQPDGTVIESTGDVGAVAAKLGNGELPPPLEEVLIGMRPGDRKTARVGPLVPRQDDLVHRVRVQELPEKVAPRVGEKLEVHYADGKAREATITEIGESMATLDANHPLAGRELVFDVELVSVS